MPIQPLRFGQNKPFDVFNTRATSDRQAGPETDSPEVNGVYQSFLNKHIGSEKLSPSTPIIKEESMSLGTKLLQRLASWLG